jgi:hypothetical protein
MINKKGVNWNYFLGLVIAAVGIVLLFFGFNKLFLLVVDQESENAKEIINKIEVRIKNLNDGELSRLNLKGQENWFLKGWSKDDPLAPDKCLFESCICICQKEGVDRDKACGKSGECRMIDVDEIETNSVIEYIIPPVGAQQVVKPVTDLKTVNYIDFPNNLIELEISKTETRIEIKKNE